MAVLEDSCQVAYDAFAPYYDAFTAHPNYVNWVRSLEALARDEGLTGRRVLDVGCGTGASVEPLVDLGYDVVGCDASPGMVERASAKLGERARLLVADARDLPRLGEFDLVWSLNDTVNYLTEERDVRSAFACIAAQLAPTGLYVFDVNTRRTYEHFFATTEVRETDALMMTWIGSGERDPRPGDLQEARLVVYARCEDEHWIRSAHHHRQRYHPLEFIEDALRGAGLHPVVVHGLTVDATLDPKLDEDVHTKAIFVVRPENAERR